MLVFTSILMGGGIVQGQQSSIANGGFLFPHDSCVFQTDTFYGNYTIDYFFVSNSTNFELSVLENYSLIHNIVIEKMLIYNSNDSLIDQISINLSTFTKSFSVPTIGDTFKIQLQVVSPLNIYDFDICLKKQLWFTLYHCLYNFSGTTNCDLCGADGLNDNGTPFFFDDDVEYGICEMTNCGPDSMKFNLNANWSDPNYRFEWYFHGVNGNTAYIDQISAQPKYRYYSTVGYDTVDVLFFDHNFATYPFKAWVQLIIKTIEAPVITATVQPTPVCPSCNSGYQDSVIFDYNAHGFYECTNHWIYWHNGIPLPAGVGQPPYVAKYNFTGVDSVTIWWENACGTDTLTLPVYISNQPYFTYDTVCVGSATNLYAQTNCPLNTFTAYEWDFGNGNIASGPIVSYTFPNSGTFPIQLTITDDCGNTESYTNNVYVRDLPVFEAELDYFTNCSTDTIHGSIINPVPYYNYTWHVSPIGALNFLYGNNGANVVMVTNNSLLTIPTYIIIQATDVNGGCKSIDTLLFFPCCTDSNTVIYLSDTTLTSYNSFGQIPIMINGEVTFDADQDFTGTNIWFGPMAKIVVSPGVNTSFTTCALAAGCEYMWQGIELIDNTTTIEVSGSKILDAIDFVVSNDGAYYNIHDNDAVKNNNCVLSVINAPAGFTGVFSNNNISCDAGSMWPPYNGKYAFCGVETNQSQNIMIGPGNTFKGLLNGIWSESSQIIVKGNTFKNIHTTQLFQITKAAIYISNGFSDINTPLLISYVGGINPADGNLFQNCLNGVVAEYQQQLQVENNEFKSIQNYGVKYSWFHQFSTMLIANNSFTNTAVGVYAYLNLKMPSYIESNTFTWNGNPLTATAIQVLGTKYKWEEFYITNNTISKAKTGISINTANNCYIKNNTIENLRNNSGPFKSYGIRMV
ncbi:MAG: PKD domain-containing protein, partial [Bacteroidales bacterium]|nr:PKD domain-containing protein [Bacteroidales bacterium]